MPPAFARIAVPVDGSPASRRGLEFAITLARDGGALVLASVVDTADLLLPQAEGALSDPGPAIAAADRDARATVRRAAAHVREAGVSVEGFVLSGERVEAFEAFAHERHAEAIVIGTNGRTGIARAVLGSMTEGLLVSADMPVIAVHADDAVREGPVLVAFDGSAPARAALEVALHIARARGRKLVLAHILTKHQQREEAERALTAVAEPVRTAGVTVEVMVEDGDPAAALIAAADQRVCAAIVTGTRALPSLERFMLGSVATVLVEHAHVPVLVARAPRAPADQSRRSAVTYAKV
jgi:nucleotide-binding universal stress UspA family protein